MGLRHVSRHLLRLRLGISLLIALATLIAFAATASAQTNDDAGAVDEYVEDIPTSEGSTPVGGGKSKREALPKDVAAQVQEEGGDDAEALETVATSSAYGAPQKRAQKRAATKRTRSERDEATPQSQSRPPREEPVVSSDGALAAAATATTGESGKRLLGLLIALGLVSAIAVGIVAARQAQRRP